MNFIFTSLLNNWRTGKKGTKHTSLLAAILMLSLPALLAGCSGGDAPAAATSSTSDQTFDGYTLYLNTSQNSIVTDSTDSATITATVAKNSVRQANILVSFETTGGLLSYPSEVTTDSEGEATITLKSGPKASNQVISVTASSSGARTSVPVQIAGNTLELSITQATMAVGTSQILTALIKNAKPQGISSAPVSFTIESGSDVVSLSSNLETSNYNGETKVTVTPISTGEATISATSLGTSAKIKIAVAAAAQVFEITSPVISPSAMATDGSLNVTVNAPTQTYVTFQTTLGIWNGLSNYLTVPVTAGVATATLTSTDTGRANITVIDAAAPTTKDTLEVNIYAPASQAATIILDSSLYNMPTSPGDTKNSAALTAIVRTAPTATQPSGGVVGNAQVNFTISNQPGGGEQVSPGMATTNSSGTATTTFSSGSLESGATGVVITATVAGTSISDNVKIVITERPGSIVLGRATKLETSADETSYTKQITAQVVDANGNPVANKRIYLKLWPTYYFLGFWAKDSEGLCVTYYTPWTSAAAAALGGSCDQPYYHANEDLNMNLAKDVGEDDGPMGAGDGFLTPPNSAAGSVPAYVTTDESGAATFEITYLKRYASWVQVHLEASTSVQMTENLASLDWILTVTTTDAQACSEGGVFDSPFGYEYRCY